MGADGGVCWMTLKPGKTVADFNAVFEPWCGSLLSLDRGSSWADDSRYEFLDKNDVGGCVGSYGTDIYGPSMDDLNYYVMPFLKECLEEGCETWRDVVLSIYTRPHWTRLRHSGQHFMPWMENAHPYISRQMDSKGKWETGLDALWRHLETPDASPFWNRNLREWMKELSETVEGVWEEDIFFPGVMGEETWT